MHPHGRDERAYDNSRYAFNFAIDGLKKAVFAAMAAILAGGLVGASLVSVALFVLSWAFALGWLIMVGWGILYHEGSLGGTISYWPAVGLAIVAVLIVRLLVGSKEE